MWSWYATKTTDGRMDDNDDKAFEAEQFSDQSKR